jgi:hypothetical protein
VESVLVSEEEWAKVARVRVAEAALGMVVVAQVAVQEQEALAELAVAARAQQQ